MQALESIERFYAEDFIEKDYSDSNGYKWDLMQSIDMPNHLIALKLKKYCFCQIMPKIGAPLVAAVEIQNCWGKYDLLIMGGEREDEEFSAQEDHKNESAFAAMDEGKFHEYFCSFEHP